MPTREQIRKGIEQYTNYPAALWAYLHENGLVIKVDRELPSEYSIAEFGLGDPLFDRDSIKEAGYVAVKPLIKEK